MMMRVGPYLYRVKRVEGYIWHEGHRCLGLCDNDQHELLVSDVPSQAQQVQVICHEYIEAWLYHFGGALNEHVAKEAMCDLFGMAMAQFAMDYMHQMRQWGNTDQSQSQSLETLVSGDMWVNQSTENKWAKDREAARQSEYKKADECKDSTPWPLDPSEPVAMNMQEQVEQIEKNEPAWRVRIYEPVS